MVKLVGKKAVVEGKGILLLGGLCDGGVKSRSLSSSSGFARRIVKDLTMN